MKRLFMLLAILLTGFCAKAQFTDCYIIFKYDASGNRKVRFYNCLPPNQPLTQTSEVSPGDEMEKEEIKGDTYSIVYPNPNPGSFWVEFKSSDAASYQDVKRKIYLLNNLGQVVLELESSERKVHIIADQLPSGNYFVAIYDGVKNTSHKIAIIR